MTTYKLLQKKEKTLGERVLLVTITINKNKDIQRLLLEKDTKVYGNNFDDRKYAVLKFAIKEGFEVEVN